jgi:hypothetical protein
MGTIEVCEMDLPYVDASGYGDGYQVYFEKNPDADYAHHPDDTSPYFLIQRNFEPPITASATLKQRSRKHEAITGS